MTELRQAPIGVFDSGVGGLSVLAEIQQLLPDEPLLYVGDCGHIPYGEKSPAYIRERCGHVARFFQEQGAKAVVVACNTATVAAVADLRQRYPHWPLVAMEPAVKPAAAATRNGIVGVLATTGTLQSATFAGLLDRFAADITVVSQPCPGLVELIEAGDLYSYRLKSLLQTYLQPLVAARCDTLILGCTHYPFLKPLLRELVGEEVVLIDTGAAVARQLRRLLEQHDLLARGPAGGARFWTSGSVEHFRQVLPALWKGTYTVECFTD